MPASDRNETPAMISITSATANTILILYFFMVISSCFV
jgi:hypothetical protein